MNTKSLLLCLSCLLAIVFTTSTVNAGPHRRGHNNFNSTRTRSGVPRNFIGGNRIAHWTGQRWSGRNFVGKQYWSGNNSSWYWRHHHRRFRDFVFIDVGFPFFGSWGYPYYYDYYPYGCYPSAYPYGYSGGGYYDNGYYGSSNYNYGNGYDNNSYGYTNGSNVAELQRKLADAGYYRGPIDGIMGSRTYYALKAYRHDHGDGNDRNTNRSYSPTLRDKPYSPPPITNEPSQDE